MSMRETLGCNRLAYIFHLPLRSYLCQVSPPIAYIFPSTTATPNPVLAVGIDSMVVHESSVALTKGKERVDRPKQNSNRMIVILLFSTLSTNNTLVNEDKKNFTSNFDQNRAPLFLIC